MASGGPPRKTPPLGERAVTDEFSKLDFDVTPQMVETNPRIGLFMEEAKRVNQTIKRMLLSSAAGQVQELHGAPCRVVATTSVDIKYPQIWKMLDPQVELLGAQRWKVESRGGRQGEYRVHYSTIRGLDSYHTKVYPTDFRGFRAFMWIKAKNFALRFGM